MIATPPQETSTLCHSAAAASEELCPSRRDWLIVAGLFALALAVRVLFALVVVFPPLDDPAYYLQVARNLCRGEGFHIAVIWSHLYPFASVDHPSGELWMPLASMAICGSWLLFGESWRAAQLPGIVAGAALPGLTYLLGVRALGGARPLSLAAGLFLAGNGMLAYQSAAGDSTSLFAVLVAGAVLLLVPRPAGRGCPAGGATASPGLREVALAGALAGLAYLARAHAVVLAGCWAAGWLWRRSRGYAALAEAVAFLGVFVLAILPWSARNLLVFGSWTPPLAAMGPFLVHTDGYLALPPAPGPMTVLEHLEEALVVRLEAARVGLRSVLDLLVFPLALPALVGALTLAWRYAALRLAVLYAALLYLAAVLLTPVPSLFGTYYHSAGSSVPVLALGYAQAVHWLADRAGKLLRWPRPPFWPFWAGVLALALVQSGVAWAAVGTRHRAEAAQFAAIREWLATRPDASAGTIMTTQPATLHYLTGRPAVALPAREPPERVAETMRRYGARYLVVTEPAGHYPQAARTAAQFEPVWRDGATEVFGLR